ncbi:DUF262 domain-containing protein [Clostridium botulinum]|uniref:DUF262 domain-containing protein n=1 Tax=Clostridium botulinum TaxID=1491 RepID=A0A6B4JJW7_CLOBO|nr:DUF262 domain-containing protein [Clostridium botulinum]EES51178.1 conserved hypothetical protein [Clostridium botulinum E1 str. 'BoNT E Beluga']MBY6760143.1 DUF262 domain-containing protein [Clostridium botulinum]MBY6919052.1 DUF262 domain-containing protein [Clostridium botulinum]MCR1132225.1 DUF262 domain-containing protein [Clostridium botulinum]NFJ57304.1 DUF262 domain-containing protein [Clostridium botulinum]
MSLSNEIEEKAKEIKTDGYPMSIGELINLYKDGDLTVFPEYQRYFRWSISQKSDLIESLLLGIPIPPIFVSQDKDGKWDIVDGLQRISSIFEFVGILKNKDGIKYDSSVLIGTKFLPSLEGKKWESENEEESFTEAERRIIKRRKINIIIIDSINNPTAKYELFQRLNTNGAELTAQEIRNCLMIMIDKNFYSDIEKVCEDSRFKNVISLSERLLKEQYDKELVVRYIVAKNKNLDGVNSNEDIGKYLTDKILDIVADNNYSMKKDIDELNRTINLLDQALGSDSFKKSNPDKNNKFEGQFSLSSYESILVGISENIQYWESNQSLLMEKIKSVYKSIEYNNATARGKRPILRFKELINFSRKFFKNED